MKKIYGPFYLGENNIWHWHTECPSFPDPKNSKTMVSSNFPDEIELCTKCQQLDKKDATDAIGNTAIS